jgi:hypothetical protein
VLQANEDAIFVAPLNRRKGLQTIVELYEPSDEGPVLPMHCTVLCCTVSSGHPIGVTVEDIINGRTLNRDVARRNIETQYAPSQMTEFTGNAGGTSIYLEYCYPSHMFVTCPPCATVAMLLCR